jgi:hypothetical protein
MQNYDSGMQLTTWHNPLKVPQRAKIYQSPGNWVNFVVPPGEDRQLPSSLDPAIQRVNDDGVIVSGACPLLVRVDGPPLRNSRGEVIEIDAPKLHEALDPTSAERKSAVERLAEAQLARFAAEQVEAKAMQNAAAAESRAAERSDTKPNKR